MTLAEIETAAGLLPRSGLEHLVARLQARMETSESAIPQSHEERQAAVDRWLEGLLQIGRRIEAKAVEGPNMVEIVSEGRNRCS